MEPEPDSGVADLRRHLDEGQGPDVEGREVGDAERRRHVQLTTKGTPSTLSGKVGGLSFIHFW